MKKTTVFYNYYYDIKNGSYTHQLFVPYNYFLSFNESTEEIKFEDSKKNLEDILVNISNSIETFLEAKNYNDFIFITINKKRIEKIKNFVLNMKIDKIKCAMIDFSNIFLERYEDYDEGEGWKQE